MAYLDDTGLAYFWGKIKDWANSVFALISHTHVASDVTLMTGYSMPSSSSAISASDTLNQAVGKLEKGAADLDAGVVHMAGDEIVTGLKTFTVDAASQMIFRIPGYTRGGALSSSKAVSIPICDEQGATWDRQGAHGRFGCLECRNEADGSNYIYLSCSKNEAGSAAFVNLLLGYDANGIPFAGAPSTRSSRTEATDIVTRDWVASGGGGDVMHLSGAETVSDEKVFTSTIVNSTTKVDRSTVVSSELSAVAHRLKNGNSNNTLLELMYGRFPNGIASSTLRCYNTSGLWFDLRLHATDSNTCRLQCFSHANLSFEGAFFVIRGQVGANGYVDMVQTYNTDANNNRNVTLRCTNGNGYNEVQLGVHNESNGAPGGLTVRSTNGTISASLNGNFNPALTNSYSLGTNNLRWANVYAITTNIGSSDRRMKADIAPLPDAVLDAWDRVEWIQYRFRDAVAKKGSSARLHSGMIAQDIEEAFNGVGLNVSDYGFFCYDKWEGTPEERASDGELLHEASPAGDMYSLRYAEALCMEAAYMRRENARLKERLAALEERLAVLEMK